MAEPKKRPGSKARPPLNTSAKSPLAGQHINMVDVYSLQEVVRKCREDKGWGSNKIWKYINDNNILPEGKTISEMSIFRWYKKNIDNKGEEQDKDYAINVYAQERSMLRSLNDTIDRVTKCLENIEDDSAVKDIKDLAITQEKLLARKLSLTASVGATQDKIYTWVQFTQIVNVFLDVANEEGVDFYSKVKARIEKDPMLAEGFRKIEASGNV